MVPNDLVEELSQRPFVPFRMFVADGSVYDIRHPELCMVGLSSVLVGVTTDPNSILFERTVRIDCHHVVRTEPLLAPQPPKRPGEPPTLTA